MAELLIEIHINSGEVQRCEPIAKGSGIPLAGMCEDHLSHIRVQYGKPGMLCGLVEELEKLLCRRPVAASPLSTYHRE